MREPFSEVLNDATHHPWPTFIANAPLIPALSTVSALVHHPLDLVAVLIEAMALLYSIATSTTHQVKF